MISYGFISSDTLAECRLDRRVEALLAARGAGGGITYYKSVNYIVRQPILARNFSLQKLSLLSMRLRVGARNDTQARQQSKYL